jgi:molybdopterin-biosynthesis enzyme MoeA-like protein
MPPHCDTLDGPVVKACRLALEKGNINYILPWVPKKAEAELKKAFEKTLKARKQGKEAMELADYWFFETAVRLHREGEGAPYTGLKPAGLDWGPVVPRAEKAIEKGNPKEVIDFIVHTVQEELEERFKRAMAKKKFDMNNVDAARDYVQAELGFVLYSHGLYTAITGKGEHGEEGKGGHEH